MSRSGVRHYSARHSATTLQGEHVAGVAAEGHDRFHAVLTRKEVAEWLKVRPRQLDRLGVPCLDLGHKTKRYLAEDVKAWLEAQRRLAS